MRTSSGCNLYARDTHIFPSGYPAFPAFHGCPPAIGGSESYGSSTYDDGKIDRWEHYDAKGLVRSEDDTNDDGRPDQWQTYSSGAIHTAAYDDDKDGRPDRRWTYEGAKLVLIESDPNAAGSFLKKAELKQ
jgi:hypothetical protein